MARRPHILCYLHSFEPGGVERVALRLCNAWQAEGARVQLLLGRTDGVMGVDAPKLDYVTYSSHGVSTARFETLWLLLCLWRQVRAERPDVIFCAGNTYTIIAVVLRLLLGGSCPPLVAKISNDLERADLIAPARMAYRLWLRVQGRIIDHFVGTAEPMRGVIARALAISHERVAIIANPALDNRQIAELAASCRSTAAPGKLVLGVGRLVPQKRFDLLIRAFAAAGGSDDRLVILGDGPERRPLEALAARLGVGGKVRLEGHVADTHRWFRRCQVFVLSSDYEGLPGVVVEALAAGPAIVATDCSPTMSNLLGDGRFGQLVPPGDQNALEQALRCAGAHSPDPIGALEHARRHTVEQAAPAYLALMCDIILKHAGGNR
ncbi:MAG: hypothetical protein JWN69_152 [Alphaproteobacteria bacterium]|nr:hypothetical protein [Alphaproteobacteria bacterium]